MTERPILFSAPMVRAILDGRQTMTRRVVRGALCPYGSPGDRLWVRENFYVQPFLWAQSHDVQPIHYAASVRREEVEDYVCKPSIHMPRWASRITLELTGVRGERLQDISEADAKAEGVATSVNVTTGKTTYHFTTNSGYMETAKEPFRDLWDSLNAKRGYGWLVNPWVWAVSFSKVTP